VLLTATFVSMLLLSPLIAIQFVNLGSANPYQYVGEVPPKPDTLPPKISIDSPKNNSVYYTNHVALNLTVTGPTGPTVYSSYVENITYRADWQQNNVTLYSRKKWALYAGTNIAEYATETNLTEIAEGKHSLTVFVTYHGTYIPGDNPNTLSANGFTISGSTVVYFTLDDQIQPKIWAISVANKTFNSTDVPLTFRVNGPISQITYSLDGQKNVSISGDTTTLTGLSYGTHYLTAYPTDALGNNGKPKTVKFTVVDVDSPIISIVSIENGRTYNASSLVLNFTVNEAFSKLWYVLDGQSNITLFSNATLTGLSNGNHNVTLFATDLAGNVGVSKTVCFNVEVSESFPIVPLAAVSVASIGVFGAGLLVYFKKRKR
jgi:hypothetical protein